MISSLQRHLPAILFTVALFFGGGTLLAYLGAPIHQLVYMTPDEVKAFDASCGADGSIGSLLCRGSSVFFPWISIAVQMASPFYTYIVLSALALGVLLLLSGYHTGRFERVVMMRPAMLVLFFVLSVWLIGTTLSLTTLYSLRTPEGQRVANIDGSTILPPFQRIYEPTSQVYGGMPQNALQALRDNYAALQQRGCLSPLTNATGQPVVTRGGSAVSLLSVLCIQSSLVQRAGTQMLLVLLFLLNLLVVGRAVLRYVLRLSELPPLLEGVLAAALGALVWTAVLWALGVLGVLQSSLIRALFVGVPIALFPITHSWLRDAWAPRIPVRFAWNALPLFLGWLLLSYLALNFLNVVRPFPIGWDDLGSYLNRPRLLASYGAFIPSMSQFQWEYLTSLGFLLFGYDSTVASTFAMQINWSAGLLAVCAAYAFGRMTLGRGAGLLTAVLYYTLPMTGHFSFADMKIDNASFFTTVVTLLAVAYAIFPFDEGEDVVRPSPSVRTRLLLAAGLVAAFCFAIKATGILGIFFALTLLGGAALGWRGFAAVAIGSFGILAAFGPLSIREVGTRIGMDLPLSQQGFILTMLVLAAVVLALGAARHRSGLRQLLGDVSPFVLGLVLAILPWGIMNMTSNHSLSLSAALKAADPTAPQIILQHEDEVRNMTFAPETPVRFLPKELALDPKHPECLSSAKVEELDRYWGYGTGLSHYLLLPWRQIMNIDAYGYYVTLVPALLLFPLLLLLPFFWRKESRWLRFVSAGTFIFVVQWVLVGNGIIWYGLGMFLGLCLALEVLVRHAPDRASRWLFAFLLAASILIALTNRLWQFDTQKNTFEYPLGKVSADALREVTVPQYVEIRDSVVDRHERFLETAPYTFRMGTFISYFIPRNREILPLADNQLQVFNCLNQERDHALTLRRLLALGFNGMIFDTNTQTIEKDPRGPLHKKVEAFVAFVNDPDLALDIVVNDPGNGIAYILLPVPEEAPPTPSSTPSL